MVSMLYRGLAGRFEARSHGFLDVLARLFIGVLQPRDWRDGLRARVGGLEQPAGGGGMEGAWSEKVSRRGLCKQ